MKLVRSGSSAIAGRGLFAGESIARGEPIHEVTGALHHLIVTDKDDAMTGPDWIGIGRDLWIDPDLPVKFLNHSCAPNAAIVGRITVGSEGQMEGRYDLVAIADIGRGQEITIDYSLIEGDPLWEMPCGCEAAGCRRTIRSIESLSPERFEAYLPNVPDYFRTLYLSRRRA